MKALVVYESMFGNTEQIAQAITRGLSEHLGVELVEVTKASRELTEQVDLVVIGGPTHAFSMSRVSTRQDALRQGATHGSQEVGVRDWLGQLRQGKHAGLVATFDTRVDKVRHLPGSAANGAARTAHRLGFKAAANPESFYVRGVDGPLLEGELARARAWGEQLGTAANLTAPADRTR